MLHNAAFLSFFYKSIIRKGILLKKIATCTIHKVYHKHSWDLSCFYDGRKFHREQEAILFVYELSEFPVLLYKDGIVEGWELPVWMCANHNTVLPHDNNRMQPGVLHFVVVLKCFWQAGLKVSGLSLLVMRKGSFLGIFEKLRKTFISFRSSIYMEQLCSQWTDFHNIVWKSAKKIQVSKNSDKNTRYCT
jgi:hypothetical protein